MMFGFSIPKIEGLAVPKTVKNQCSFLGEITYVAVTKDQNSTRIFLTEKWLAENPEQTTENPTRHEDDTQGPLPFSQRQCHNFTAEAGR